MDQNDWDNLGAALLVLKNIMAEDKAEYDRAMAEHDGAYANLMHARMTGMKDAIVTITGFMGVKAEKKEGRR